MAWVGAWSAPAPQPEGEIPVRNLTDFANSAKLPGISNVVSVRADAGE
ncbi:hypothetical protein [Azospirillum palustre]